MNRARLACVSWIALVLACGEPELAQDVDATLATVTRVRGTVRVGERETTTLGRVARSQKVAASTNGLARVVLDSGPRLLVGTDARVALTGPDSVALEAGRVYAEVIAGDRLTLTTPNGTLATNDASLSVEIRGARVVLYVVRGEVTWVAGTSRGAAHAGEEVALGGGRAVASPAVLWNDWTGGLARPGPQGTSTPEGMGTLEARVPEEVGLARWPLVIRRLDVRVQVHDDLAITEVSQEFFNPASDTVEGLYRVRVPAGAVLSQFAVDRDGRLVEGFVREKAQARAAYEAQVYRGSTDDPALLEWVGPSSYKAQIYPIPPGATRRIVIRYAEWLTRPAPGAPRLYRYPMGTGASAPHVQELSLAVDLAHAGAQSVRAGMGATVEETAVLLRRSDFRPRSDFWLELVDSTAAASGASRLRSYQSPYARPRRAPGSRAITNEADERDFLFVPVVLPESLAARQERTGIDVVIVADVSSGTDRSHLELGRSVVESLTTHLGAEDRVALVTSDVTLRALAPEQRPALGPASRTRVESLLESLARAPAGGATDLGAAIGDAAALLDPTRSGIVVYVGDGAPTVGELEAAGLLERIARLPAPVRLYAVGVGADANIDLLDAVSAGGGLAERVEERAEAGEASLRILAHASRPIAQRVTFDLGSGVDGVYPRRAVDVVLGEPLVVLGRVRGKAPTAIIVRGTIAGRAFSQRFDLEARQAPLAAADLRLRWANERLRHLLLEGAGREAVAELGTRYGLITPYTSYYVPSARELREMGESASLLLHRALPISAAPATSTLAVARAPSASVFAFVALAACRSADVSSVAQVDQPTAASAPAPVTVAATAPQAAEAPEPAEEAERAVADTTTATTGATLVPAAPPPPPGATVDDATRAQLQALGYAQRAPANAPSPASPTVPMPVSPSGTPSADPAAPSGRISAGSFGALGSGSGGGGSAAPEQMELRTRRAANEPVRLEAQAQPARPRAPLMRRGATSFDLDGASDNAPAREHANGDRLAQAGQQRASAASEDGHRSREDNGWWAPGQTRGSGGYDGEGNDRGLDANDETSVERALGDDGAMNVRIVIERSRPRVRCSDASRLPLEDRRALWRERLSQSSSAGQWVAAYRLATRTCEAPGWRDRRAFLDLVLDRAGSIGEMVDVYRTLRTTAVASHLRAAILRRIRSPSDLRLARDAFGLGSEPDWPTVERLLREATDDTARVRILRTLARDYPANLRVRLRLLAALERARRIPEARRLADALRADPMADATVRTEVGEMFLRLGERDEARRAFSEIVELAPMDELARRRLGDLYRAHGWFEDAYRQYRTLATIRPDDPTVSLLLAQAAAGAGRVDEALRLEQSITETAEPGSSSGLARVAMLWSSVRFAKLRRTARGANDTRGMSALVSRMRRSGVLREAGAMRVSLVWAHPDAELALWAAYPGAALTRPVDLAPELGIEAFDVAEETPGQFRLEVRRGGTDLRTTMEAELVIVFHEGRDDERIEIVTLRFEPGRRAYAWTLDGTTLREATPTASATPHATDGRDRAPRVMLSPP